MTLQRFLVIAFLVFILGIGAIYAGVNRVPFRQGGGHDMHKSSLTPVNMLAYNGDLSSVIRILNSEV